MTARLSTELSSGGVTGSAAALGAFAPRGVAAVNGSGFIDPRSGLYLRSRQPLRAWNTTVSRAAAGIAPAKWFHLGDSIDNFAAGYAGGSIDQARSAAGRVYGIAALSGWLMMMDKADPRVSYPVGTSADWTNQSGYGPGGKSALSTTSGTARVRISFAEEYAFDQVAVSVMANSANATMAYSLDGAAEQSQAGVTSSPQGYLTTYVYTFPGGLATTHTLTLGWSSAPTARQFIVAVEPRRSDNKYISVTRCGLGGAQALNFASNTGSGNEVITSGNKWVPKIAQPDLLNIELGVNDYRPADGSAATPLDTYKTYMRFLMAWKVAAGIVCLQTQVPNQVGSRNPSQQDYRQAMYDLVEEQPLTTVLTDLYDDWGGSYAALGGTGGGWYTDGTHPSQAAQLWMSRIKGRILQAI